MLGFYFRNRNAIFWKFLANSESSNSRMVYSRLSHAKTFHFRCIPFDNDLDNKTVGWLESQKMETRKKERTMQLQQKWNQSFLPSGYIIVLSSCFSFTAIINLLFGLPWVANAHTLIFEQPCFVNVHTVNGIGIGLSDKPALI